MRSRSAYITNLIHEMYLAVDNNPASCWAEVAARVSASLGQTVSLEDVYYAAGIVRSAPPTQFGYTYPLCKKGPAEPQKVRVEPYDAAGRIFSRDDRDMMRDGSISWLEHMRSIMLKAVQQELIPSGRGETPGIKRQARALSRDLQYVADKIEDLLEVCRA